MTIRFLKLLVEDKRICSEYYMSDDGEGSTWVKKYENLHRFMYNSIRKLFILHNDQPSGDFSVVDTV